MLDTEKPLFRDDPFFNRKFIARNKIKSITGLVSTKREGDIIRKSEKENIYQFDSAGRLTGQVAIDIVLNKKKDTIFTYYRYNKSDQVVTKMKNDQDGFFSYNFEYDKEGRLVRKYYARDINVGASQKMSRPSKKIIITSERFTYKQIDDLQLKRYHYNNLDKVYKEEVITNDQYGYLLSENAKFIIGNHRHNISYEYDENGRIVKKTEEVRMFQRYTKTYTYTYDEHGNLLEQNVYKDGEHLLVKQFLLDKKTYLITAQLIKDVPSNVITIIQYQYRFYDEAKAVK